MKGALLSFFLFCVLVTGAQELVPVPGPVIPVTPNNTLGSTRPRLALVRDSIPLVIWTRTSASNDIMYAARWNGSGFSPAVQISPSGLDVYTSAEEGGDVAARGDTVFVVFFTTDSRVYAVRSVDAGVTWGDTVRVDHRDTTDAYTPDVQILPGGNPVVLFETSDPAMISTGMMVTKSVDGGMTFGMETFTHTNVSGQPCECCPPALLVKDSMVYTIYRNNANNIRNIVMTVSSDSGATFPVVSEFDQTNWMLMSCPTAGAEGRFYRDSVLAVWKSTNKIYFGCGHAMDGGAGPDQILEPSLPPNILQKQPSVCGSGDTVITTWCDRRNGNFDVFVAVSGSGPQQLDTVFIFNDTTGTAENGTQQNPHAAYYNGSIHLTYQELGSGIIYYRKASISGVVSVQESIHEESTLFTTYPNPVTNELILQNTSGRTDGVVRIIDAEGKVVAVTALQQQQTIIDCSALAPGVYFLNIQDAQGTFFTTYFIRQ